MTTQTERAGARTPLDGAPSEKMLRKLARFRSPEGVLSLYLSFPPSGGERRDVHAIVHDVLTALGRSVTDERRAGRLDEERLNVEAFFRENPELHGRTLILYSCIPRGLWETFHLQVPVRPLARFAERPAVASLAALLDRYERYAVLLVDKDRGRLLHVYLGRVEHRLEVVDEYPGRSRGGGWADARYARHRDAHLHIHLLRTAEQLLAEARRHPFDRLLVGGPNEARSSFLAVLPQGLRGRVAGTFAAELFLSDFEVVDRVRAIEEAAQQAAETRRVSDLLDTARTGGAAVLGWDETLQALGEGRVFRLVAAEGASAAGRSCPSGHFACLEELGQCPRCGRALDGVADLQEWAVERALDTDAALEAVRGDAAAALVAAGPIGAFLRY